MKPVVLSIAGLDPSGGAGVLTDARTIDACHAHPTVLVTALTAQNTYEAEATEPVALSRLESQWRLLLRDLRPQAIKVGMLAHRSIAHWVADRLRETEVPVVIDPVMAASSGAALCDAGTIELYRTRLLQRADLFTPNLTETETLLGESLTPPEAASRLLRLGARAVLIKGGHAPGDLAADYFSNGRDLFWLSRRRLPQAARGTGCALSAALASLLATGRSLPEAVVVAQSFIHQAIRRSEALGKGPGLLSFSPLYQHLVAEDYPALHTLSAPPRLPPFAPLAEPMGFYPIVDSLDGLRAMMDWGVRTIQLRVKGLEGPAARKLIQEAVALTRPHSLQLFINDYWEAAMEGGAYGVHLGQEDLGHADLARIQSSGLRLGISTHCHVEMARAKHLRPSYVAIGPIFPTTLKAMPYPTVGVERLARWRRHFDCPVVAIGGINEARGPAVLATGIDSISAVSGISRGLASLFTH